MKAHHIGGLLTAVLLLAWPGAALSQNRFLSVSERRDAPKTIVLHVRLENSLLWSTSERGARQNMLQKAQEELAEWLRKQPPYYSFKPTVEFIDRELLKKSEGTEGVVIKPEKPAEIGKDETYPMFSANVNLYLTPEAQEKLRKEAERHVDSAHAHEAWSRQWPLFKGLLFIVAMAAAVGGYFHCDDRTQGYYSNPLRLAAVAVVLAAGYGITLLP